MAQLNSFHSVLQEMFEKNRILPVVAGLYDENSAVSYARALKDGGIDNIEITLRNPGAPDHMIAIKQAEPSIVIGAGTVLTPQQVNLCADAGVSYIVSPGYDEQIEIACLDRDLPYLPGAVTPTEVQYLLARAYKYLKFFPASLNQGAATMKAYGAVFQDVKFCCTGGINQNNLQDYLSLDNVVGVGLSALAPKDLIQNKDWDAITALAKSLSS